MSRSESFVDGHGSEGHGEALLPSGHGALGLESDTECDVALLPQAHAELGIESDGDCPELGRVGDAHALQYQRAHHTVEESDAERQAGSDADREGLMRRTHAVLGLRVASASEATTMRYVASAILLLTVILVLHFVMHVVRNGRVLHAIWHLLAAGILPAAGYVAVSQHSAKAAWAFHVTTVLASLAHFLALVSVLSELLPRLLHTRIWTVLGDVSAKNADEITNSLLYASASSSTLEVWWVIVSVPVWVLCLFLAYHSLEFYIQLRVKHLGARVDRASADATVFERGTDPEGDE